jgi:molybdate transport system substrate-binding protein
MREPMEQIVPLYQRKTGVRIETHYGASETLLLELQRSKGDVFLPADESYIADAQRKGLLRDVLPLAQMNVTLVVSPKSDKSITHWDDLFREQTSIAIADPNAAAVSRRTHAHLGEEKWRELAGKSTALGPVTDVANAVKLGTVDAGIIWDSMVASPNYRMLKIVRIKELEGITATIKIGVVKESADYDRALAFTRFIVEKCPEIWEKHGFALIKTESNYP